MSNLFLTVLLPVLSAFVGPFLTLFFSIVTYQQANKSGQAYAAIKAEENKLLGVQADSSVRVAKATEDHVKVTQQHAEVTAQVHGQLSQVMAQLAEERDPAQIQRLQTERQILENRQHHLEQEHQDLLGRVVTLDILNTQLGLLRSQLEAAMSAFDQRLQHLATPDLVHVIAVAQQLVGRNEQMQHEETLLMEQLTAKQGEIERAANEAVDINQIYHQVLQTIIQGLSLLASMASPTARQPAMNVEPGDARPQEGDPPRDETGSQAGDAYYPPASPSWGEG